MDVYLVPVGAARYELYCEVPDAADDQGAEAPRGFVRRMTHAFRQMLADAERERRQGRTDQPRGWMARVKARSLRWVSESIAEQRLLWHLRNQESAAFHYPDDLDEPRAVALLRQQLGRDFDKHRFWLAIDSVGLAGSALLIVVPGPNVLGYYFAFRVVGHYLSLRGAKRGLSGVAWQYTASGPLSELRRIAGIAPHAREEQVQDVATRLRLEHLAGFYQRTAIPT